MILLRAFTNTNPVYPADRPRTSALNGPICTTMHHPQRMPGGFLVHYAMEAHFRPSCPPRRPSWDGALCTGPASKALRNGPTSSINRSDLGGGSCFALAIFPPPPPPPKSDGGGCGRTADPPAEGEQRSHKEKARRVWKKAIRESTRRRLAASPPAEG